MQVVTNDLTVRKQVTVPLSQQQAFALFTERIGEWWPTRTHALAEDASVVFEPRHGGAVYEVAPDGTRAEWARVTAYDPPRRFVLEWRVSTPSPPYTEVEVRFAADGDATRVELEHRGWERLAERGHERAASYDTGWDAVLGHYVAAARS